MPSRTSLTDTATALYVTRSVRAVADGLVAASLATLLGARGHDERAVGLIVTATLLGSAATLLAVSRAPHILTPMRVLVVTAVLMSITGAVFGLVGAFPVLLAAAVIGPLNPTGGDVSAFLPAEQTLITNRVPAERRTTSFARYSFVGAAGVALGAALAGPVAALGRALGFDSTDGTAFTCLVYGSIGLVTAGAYVAIATGASDTALGAREVTAVAVSRLGPSRRRIRELTAVFALDAAGGGFVVSALIASWLHSRFGFDPAEVGAVLGAATLASAASALFAPRLTKRFGLVETMAFTHLPANALLIGAGLAPSAAIAVALLIARALLSQLDVPARQAFVMTIVEPSERAAAAAFTNLPRSLAGATTPLLGGWLLHTSTIGWPLVIGGLMKAVYDVLLLWRFRRLSTKV